MANTIQLRNSVVKDKAPLPSDLVIGEVCVGANSESPMLLFKDNADNIIKIEPGSGVTPGPDAPDSPSAGDLWFDTNTELLYYYNGTDWVELGTAGDSPVTSVNGEVGAVVLKTSDLDNDSGYITLAETLWEEDGTTLIPREDGAGLKIEGSVDGIESTIINGTFSTTINDGNTQQLFVGLKGDNTLFFVSHAGEIYADGITTTKGVTLETDTESDGLYVRTTGGGSNAITALADGNINATGKITAAVFDLESLSPLPA